MPVPNAFKYPSPFVVQALKLIGLAISKPFWLIRFHGRENIPNTPDGYVIAANHQTYIDPVWITIPIKRRLRFMAFETAFGWRYIGRLIRYLGAFPVALDGRRSKEAFRTALRTLKEGSALVVFPEGAREFADGEFLEFKEGAMRLAIAAGVEVLPVTIRNGNRIWPQKQKYPSLFRRVEVIYHQPYRPETEDAEAETARLKALISSKI